MFCPTCGTEQLKGTTFCSFCGAELPKLPEDLTANIENTPINQNTSLPMQRPNQMPNMGMPMQHPNQMPNMGMQQMPYPNQMPNMGMQQMQYPNQMPNMGMPMQYPNQMPMGMPMQQYPQQMPNQHININITNQSEPKKASKSKITAAILGLLFGGIGVHKLYLGKPIWGILYLLFFWTGIPSLFAFIESISYLCTPDDAWNRKY